MDKDVAIRLDGMILGASASLDGIAHYMKNNLPDDEYQKLVLLIGRSMGDLFDISQSLYARFPDIVPAELRPPGTSME